MGRGVLATARRTTDVDPVGRAIARALEAGAIHIGLRQVDRVSVDALPVLRELAGHVAQRVRSQMTNLHPGQDQEPRIVGNQVQVASPCGRRPPEEAVAGAELRRRGRPPEAPHDPPSCIDQKFQVLPHRRAVAEVVVGFDQEVEQLLLIPRPPDLPQLDRPQLGEAAAQRRSIDLHPGRLQPPRWLPALPPRRRQLDLPRPMQRQHHPPAHHVLQRPVGLPPAPRLAQLAGQRSPTCPGMGSDELPDEGHVPDADFAASVGEHCVHARKLSTDADRTQVLNRRS